MPRVVQLSYERLQDDSCSLQTEIEEAFGPDGLGVLTVSGVPGYSDLRKELLPLGARFSQLDDAAKAACEDPESKYNIGWSCGKEKLVNGAPDTLKASFYANPLCDNPTLDPELQARHPGSCRPNLWPRASMPELEPAFKALARIIYSVGLLLTNRCDRYLHDRGILPVVAAHQLLAADAAPGCKARLLCYLPSSSALGGVQHDAVGNGSAGVEWCGWHTDHGALTGLTSAMFTDASGQPKECPDPEAGLCVVDRKGELVHVRIPADNVAFQLGEVFQILSGGALRATPHCVRAPSNGGSAGKGVYRNTLAVFMQPRWDVVLDIPSIEKKRTKRDDDLGMVTDPEVACWQPGISFGEFSERKFESYYG